MPSEEGLQGMEPGATQLTVTPNGPSCRASPIIAALGAAQAWMPVSVRARPAPLEMLTMRP